MSTFPGLLDEIPKISVDRFDGKNLFSEAFFLSHFHEGNILSYLKQFFFQSYNILKLFLLLNFDRSYEWLEKYRVPQNSPKEGLGLHIL